MRFTLLYNSSKDTLNPLLRLFLIISIHEYNKLNPGNNAIPVATAPRVLAPRAAAPKPAPTPATPTAPPGKIIAATEFLLYDVLSALNCFLRIFSISSFNSVFLFLTSGGFSTLSSIGYIAVSKLSPPVSNGLTNPDEPPLI